MNKERMGITLKTKFEDKQHQRVYVTNFVARNYKGSRQCFICGKENSQILHNDLGKDPYTIAFICAECRKDPNKVERVNKVRINILDFLDMNNKGKHLNNTDLLNNTDKIIRDALNANTSLKEYLNSIHISYYKFTKIIQEYDKRHNTHIQNVLYKKFQNLKGKKIRYTKNKTF